MLGHAKRPAVEHPHGLKKPVTIHKPAVIDGDDGLRVRHKLTVQKHIHADVLRQSGFRGEKKKSESRARSAGSQEIEGARHACRFTVKIHGGVRNSEGLGTISLRACHRSAARKPPALDSVSSYSAAGIESATMPAPTWKY